MSVDRHESLDGAERSMAVGYAVIGAILIGGGIGYVLDQWLGTRPWLLIVGLAASLVVALVGLRQLLRSQTQ